MSRDGQIRARGGARWFCILALAISSVMHDSRAENESKASQGPPAREGESVTTNTEFRVRPWNESVKLGEAVYIDVMVRNLGDEQASYHTSPHTDTSDFRFEVTDPSGKQLVQMALPASKSVIVDYHFLQPHSEACCAKGLNLSDCFAFLVPGVYKIGFMSAPSANAATVTLNPGEVDPLDRIASALLPILLEGWQLGKCQRLCMVEAWKPGLKMDGLHLCVFQVSDSAEEDAQQYAKTHGTFLGRGRLGPIYVRVGTGAKTLWGDPIAKLKSLLIDQ